jgi:predicted Zn-dependent protease
MRRLRDFALIAVVTSACSASSVPSGHAQKVGVAHTDAASAPPRGDAVSRGFAALAASRYAEAEAAFRSVRAPDAAKARLGLALTLLETGRYALAEQTAVDTLGATPAIALELVRVRGEALRRRGDLATAEQVLTAAASDPVARRVRLLLGEVLIEQGKKAAAEPVLMSLIQEYNSDAIDPKDGAALALVGRAAYLLGSPGDANDAFNEAERAGAKDSDTLLFRAEVFLESYDPGHAEEVVGEVLERAPHHPDALALMAEVKLASTLDFDEAEKLAKAALEQNPALGRAEFVLGGVALRDMNLAEADAHVASGLSHDPRDLDLLSLRAAIRFLADDSAGFEKAKADVLAKNGRYSRLYQIVGEYAEWEHRYEEIVSMMREALLANADDAKVRAQLGFNLIRSGEEAEGVQSLRRAFGSDPFNVRVFNTLNLYEKEIPKGYETLGRGKFTLRYHKEETKILDRYVPSMLERAWAKMVKGYGFTPKVPVGVELYPSREHFAVRTSGLPQTFIQGVCFGRTLAAMSPRGERFNIGMTLWHELAHVFHIQLSRSHVPRWFTEGLAEYETLIERPEWRREYDRDLYLALQRGRIPAVADMNRTFSHAEDMSDMATAYYASTQIVRYIADTWGMPKVRQMLELWGQGKRTPEVIRQALGVSPEEVDKGFRAAVGIRLSIYQGQFSPPDRPKDREEAEASAVTAPEDPQIQADLALARMGSGDEAGARTAIARALALNPKQGEALWLKVQLEKTGGNKPGAKKALDDLVAAGHDGYSVRLAFADVVATPAERHAALEAAHRFDPLQSAPLRALAELANAEGNAEAELGALRSLVILEENDGDSYRRLLELLISRGAFEEARKVGEAGVFVDVESATMHMLYADALAGAGARKDALFEFESATLTNGEPAELARAHQKYSEALAKAGDKRGAAAHAKTAAELRDKEKAGPT